ncbi:MAG: caspase family protein [Saprospiraceae bacterium]|nr:caspase family protein [Saprospiraceae bacterium]
MMSQIKWVAVLTFFIFPLFLKAECLSGNCFTGRGTYLYPSGAKYVGQFKNGFIHGNGTLYFSTGHIYVGEWAYQFREGTGKFTYANGDEYNGQFKKSKFDGRGTMQYHNGDSYTGAWKNSLPNGVGTYTFSSGERYEGDFKNGQFDGQGTMSYDDGSKYIGTWKKNEKDGLGTVVYANGKKKLGVWENGKMREEQMPAQETAVANQPVAQPDRNQSNTTLENQSVTTGYERDCNSEYCRDGQGTYIYADGSKYIGEFKYGYPEGKGTVFYSNGDKYEGAWANHAPNGPGVIYFASGKARGGLWRNGKMVGEMKPVREQVKEKPVAVDYSDEVKIWAVVVGVGRYQHMPALRYTDDDAYQMYAFLKSVEGGSLTDDQVKILVDEDATRMNVLTTIHNTLLKADENDVIVFYFSGHGLEGSFLPVDYDGYNNRILHEEIRDLMKKSKANQKVVFADACHSGSILAMKAPVKETLDRYYGAFENAKGGIALMMSSKGEEYSLEDGGLRSGIFSYFLIKGLKGEADRNSDKIVTISELFNYVKRSVVDYTAGAQTPTISGDFDNAMPVAVRR